MKNEYKSIFNKITPKQELKEKVLNLENSDKRIAFKPQKAIALVAAVAIMITGSSLGAHQLAGKPFSSVYNTTSNSDNQSPFDFSIVVYAEEKPESTAVISENEIELIDYKIKAGYDNDGNPTVYSTDSSMGFKINCSDVESVTFKSETGNFHYFDSPKQQKMIDDKKYYIEIPLSDKENELYHQSYENRAHKFFEYLMENNDYSEYFSDNSTNIDDYSIYYSDKEDYANENQILLVKDSYYNELNQYGKSITAKAYTDSDIIQNIYYDTTYAQEILLHNIDTEPQTLPSDTITITVKLKSGQTETKVILAKFNSNGVLTMQYK